VPDWGCSVRRLYDLAGCADGGVSDLCVIAHQGLLGRVQAALSPTQPAGRVPATRHGRSDKPAGVTRLDRDDCYRDGSRPCASVPRGWPGGRA
jgi:hypothetical protein